MLRRASELKETVAFLTCASVAFVMLLSPASALAGGAVASGTVSVTVLSATTIHVSGIALGGTESDGPIPCGSGHIQLIEVGQASANTSMDQAPPPWQHSVNIKLTVTQVGHNNSCTQGYLLWEYTYGQDIDVSYLAAGTHTIYVVFTSISGGSTTSQQFTLP